MGIEAFANSWAGIGLLFLFFVYFFLGSLGYGFLLRRFWRDQGGLLENTSDSFLLASALLWFVATLLASVHGLRWLPGWAASLVFLPGFLALLRESRLFQSALKNRSLCSFLFLFLFVFLLRALSAALPSRHGDPLLYHLLGPRLWMESGGFAMHRDLPTALLASSWEILYLWPQIFWFSTRPLFGLVEAQIFSQWMHLFFAWAGSGLLVMRLFQGALSPALLPMVGLSALFVSGLHWTAPLAKNDMGVAFWTLGAIVYFLEAFRKKSFFHAGLSGLFAGLALSGKVTALLSLGPILFTCLLAARPWRYWFFSFSSLLFWISGLLVGALPVYARNWILSGNPFYPLFPKLFPSPFLSPSFEAHFAQVHPGNPLEAIPRLWLRLPELWRESPFIFFAAALFTSLVYFLQKQRKGDSRDSEAAFLGGSFLAYSVFVLTQSVDIELRYLGASLQILAGGGVVFLLGLANRISSAKLRLGAFSLVLVSILGLSKLPLHVAYKIWKEPLGEAYISTHSSGEAKKWLRENAGKEFTVMVSDNESYYLTPIAHAVLSERADLDAATRGESNFSRFVAVLCEKSGAKYLFDSHPSIGIAARFGAALPKEAILFSAQGANVYDLEKIETLVAPGSRNCHK